jgi:hypothetical protein
LTAEPLHILDHANHPKTPKGPRTAPARKRTGHAAESHLSADPSPKGRIRQTVKLTPSSSGPTKTPKRPTCKTSEPSIKQPKPPACLFRHQIVKEHETNRTTAPQLRRTPPDLPRNTPRRRHGPCGQRLDARPATPQRRR